MGNSFSGLMQTYGTPALVIPNTPITSFPEPMWGHPYHASPVGAVGGQKVGYHRSPLAAAEEADFLLVHRQIEVTRREAPAIVARLSGAGHRIVEYQLWFQDRDWVTNRVRLTLEEDVTPISRADLARAASERRVLWLGGSRSMGDWYLQMGLAGGEDFPGPSNYPGGNEYHFYFPAPGGLPLEEVPYGGDEFSDSPREFFNSYKSWFTRPLPAGLPRSGRGSFISGPLRRELPPDRESA